MIPPFENFQSKFVEEALDNINELEKALLELDLSPNDKELLEKVFRIMHSLKGGGGMFGFDQLSEFSHHMENIYDKIRSGQLAVSSDILSITLKSVDMLRDLLNVESMKSPEMKTRYKEIVGAIDNILKKETEKRTSIITPDEEGANQLENDEITGMATYYIHFYPAEHALKNGMNILYVLDDLAQLGTLKSVPRFSKVPDLEELLPHQSYIFWDLFLSTDLGKSAINDVFMFVADDAVIEIHQISNTDLFIQEQFSEKLDALCESKTEFELPDLQEFMTEQPDLNIMAYGDKSLQPMDSRRIESSSIRVDFDKIDSLVNLVSELVITQQQLNLIATHHQIPELKLVSENIQKLTGQLRDSTFSISLIPIDNMMARFQRLVRDLSTQLGKTVKFVAVGTETELDKTMIESLTDPLLHIIRNSIDHGIELPDVRRKAGKSPEGNITLEAGYSGANVVIKIMDDGAGVDCDKVRQKAIEKGLIRADERPTEEEILNLLFVPGFSTSSTVTEVSGRGVGMDVVKRNIGAVRGNVAISSERGKGSCITISLPLVLSIIDGLLVRIDHTEYVIPLSLTDRIYPADSKMLEDSFIDVITLDGVQVSFINLRKELEVIGKMPARCQVVVVKDGDNTIALSVDKVMGKIQAVLKPLGRLYHHQKIISAATIMGDGSIALVLDVNTLIREVIGNQ